MKSLRQHTKKKYLLGNMINDCCLKLLLSELRQLPVEIISARLGEITLSFGPDIEEDTLLALFSSLGFKVIEGRDHLLVEEIKRVVVELVHHTTFNAMVRNSDFLVGRFNKSYQYLSAVFSRTEKITLEKYIILQRIEKVKELIQQEELSLSEIAHMMGYSSVQYLSTQFKQVTGYSVTEYKALPEKERLGIRLQSREIE
ncbi:MAG: AraC family transcriptional regulator [Bacteroidales bacterium]|jgi:AraC-like DNA-binding protein|nr:AraC family transcriptional regulator [Bacteroidales bacterium]MDD3700572.1 AraC family transcriptional regulator [Bacteroidales bacterium]MDY0368304.1 AraC family transcriptional regulator [Bacteroidales bacterium]